MCCARFCGAGFGMDGCWGRRSRFSIEMVYAVRDLMQGAYPELVDSAERVAKVVEAEEKQFDRVLKSGLEARNSEQLRAEIERSHVEGTVGDSMLKANRFPASDGFSPLRNLRPAARLHGRCGARRRMWTSIDDGFEAARAEEQARARASWKGGSQKIGQPGVSRSAEDRFSRATSSSTRPTAKCWPS